MTRSEICKNLVRVSVFSLLFASSAYQPAAAAGENPQDTVAKKSRQIRLHPQEETGEEMPGLTSGTTGATRNFTWTDV
jgi:hypothetical protein